MKKNIVIIILLGIVCAFGILLVQVTRDNTCKPKKVITKKTDKKETKKEVDYSKYIGYYVARTQVDNPSGEQEEHSLYVALYDNNTAVITYKEGNVARYIGGYKIDNDMIIIKSMYRNSHENYGIGEDLHKIKIGDNKILNYFTDELEGYKIEFNNIALTKIEKIEYDEGIKD